MDGNQLRAFVIVLNTWCMKHDAWCMSHVKAMEKNIDHVAPAGQHAMIGSLPILISEFCFLYSKKASPLPGRLILLPLFIYPYWWIMVFATGTGGRVEKNLTHALCSPVTL